MGLTQDQAAERLHVSKSQVANWDAGKVRGRARGEKAVPPFSVRVLMTALAVDSVPTPWPE